MSNLNGFAYTSINNLSAFNSLSEVDALRFVALTNGSAGAPSFSWSPGNKDSGFYMLSDNASLGVSIDGKQAAEFNSSSFRSISPIHVTAGTLSNLALTFITDTDTGIYTSSANNFDISCGGVRSLNINSSNALFRSGTGTTPSISFISNPATGFANSATGFINFISNSAEVATLKDINFSLYVPIIAANGSVSAPSLAFASSFSTGLYASAANNLDVSCGGTNVLNVSSNGIKTVAGGASNPSISFLTDTDTGIYLSNPDQIAFSCGTQVRFVIDSDQAIRANLRLRCINGTEASPAFSWLNDTDTGFYRTTTDNAFFMSCGGTKTMEFFQVATRFLDGSSSVPGIAFINDPNTGIYRIGADQLGIATNGAGRWQINASGHFLPLANNSYDIGESATIVKDIYAGRLILPFAGSETAPSLTFATDTNTGIYNVGGDFLGFSTGGVLRLQIGPTNSQFTTRIQGQAESAATPTFSFTGDTNTGIYSSGADSLSVSTGGVARVTINTTNLISDLPILGPNGTAGAPSFTFNGSTNTGIYRPSAGIIGFSCTSSLIGQFSPNGLFLTDGTQANPSYTFINDTNTGFYSYTADQIGIACGGTLVGRFFNSGFIINGNIFTNLTPSGGTLHWYLRTNGSVLRNAIGMSATEGGSDSGSNLAFWNYTDGGGFKAQIYENERSTNNNYFWGRLWVGQTGSTTIPSIGFLNQTDCGMSSFYTDQIEFITNSVHRFSITNNSILPALDALYSLGSGSLRFNTIFASVGAINTSDRTLKDDITPCSLGLDFINQLKPVKYKWKNRTYEEKYYDDEAKEEKIRTIEKIHSRHHYGLIAQDVKETLDELKIDSNDAGFYIDSSYNEPGVTTLGLNYTQFIAPLVKAVQELSALVATQQNEISLVKDRLTALEGV